MHGLLFVLCILLFSSARAAEPNYPVGTQWLDSIQGKQGACKGRVGAPGVSLSLAGAIT